MLQKQNSAEIKNFPKKEKEDKKKPVIPSDTVPERQDRAAKEVQEKLIKAMTNPSNLSAARKAQKESEDIVGIFLKHASVSGQYPGGVEGQEEQMLENIKNSPKIASADIVIFSRVPYVAPSGVTEKTIPKDARKVKWTVHAFKSYEIAADHRIVRHIQENFISGQGMLVTVIGVAELEGCRVSTDAISFADFYAGIQASLLPALSAGKDTRSPIETFNEIQLTQVEKIFFHFGVLNWYFRFKKPEKMKD